MPDGAEPESRRAEVINHNPRVNINSSGGRRSDGQHLTPGMRFHQFFQDYVRFMSLRNTETAPLTAQMARPVRRKRSGFPASRLKHHLLQICRCLPARRDEIGNGIFIKVALFPGRRFKSGEAVILPAIANA